MNLGSLPAWAPAAHHHTPTLGVAEVSPSVVLTYPRGPPPGAWSSWPPLLFLVCVECLWKALGPQACRFRPRHLACAWSPCGTSWGSGRFNVYFFLIDVIFKILFIYFWTEREGREREKERNINVWLPLMCPLLGTWSAIQACALTGNRTSDPLIHRPTFNPLSHNSQGREALLSEFIHGWANE